MSASVTIEDHRVGKVVVAWDKGMKDMCCLACSDPDLAPMTAMTRYGFRFECEETFRDLKDPRFGMGLRHCRIASNDRRDRILLLAVLAHAMLTLLDVAGERCGLDRDLKTNTSKTRQHSLLRQWLMWYDLVPNIREDDLPSLLPPSTKSLTNKTSSSSSSGWRNEGMTQAKATKDAAGDGLAWSLFSLPAGSIVASTTRVPLAHPSRQCLLSDTRGVRRSPSPTHLIPERTSM